MSLLRDAKRVEALFHILAGYVGCSLFRPRGYSYTVAARLSRSWLIILGHYGLRLKLFFD